jgi:hypothetical protein
MNQSCRVRLSLVCALALAMSVVSSGSARADCPSGQYFASSTPYTAGVHPHDVAIGDFNQDGNLDVVVANADDNTVALYLGFGDGTFILAHTLTGIGVGPAGLTLCDLNQDGHLDVVVANQGDNTVTVLLGSGTGTFAPGTSFAAGSAPFRVIAADFNKDGIPDLAVVDNAGGGISVLIAHGSGGVWNGMFDAPSFYLTGIYASGVAAADFNGDGILDLAVSNYGANNVRLLVGNGSGGVGNGTFSAGATFPTDGHPFSLLAADLNADGITDLATSNSQGNDVSVLIGQGAGGVGNGAFDAAANYPVGGAPSVLALLDVDGDGVGDLVTGNATTNDVTLLRGQSTGGFADGTYAATGNFAVGVYPISVATADVNKDGRPDVVAVNYYSNSFSVLLGACVSGPPPPGPEPVITSVRDVKGDQGGHVFVTWLASTRDNSIDRGITSYRVWRRIPADLLRANPAQPASAIAASGRIHGEVRALSSGNSTEITYWEAVATLPAQFLEGYGYTASTFGDSTASGIPYAVFFVSAVAPDPTVFYSSVVDSGYSVDNKHPEAPSSFVAVPGSSGIALHWMPVAAPDVAQYVLYRGTTPVFTWGPASQVAAQADTGYVDAAGATSSYYKLVAFDVHGNASTTALAHPAGTLGVSGDGAMAFALTALRPNPARGDRLHAEFSLAREGAARLELIDVAGRSVARRDLGVLAAGRHDVDLNPRARLAPGVYLMRLVQGGNAVSRRVTVVE